MRRDRGHAGIELALAVGVLMIPAALAVIGFGPWTERSVLAEAIASEASRAAVLALSVDEGNQIASEMASNFGLDDGEVRLGWCGAAPGAGGSGSCSMGRGEEVSVSVEVWVPLINTPWGGIGGIWAGAVHAEQIDLYRSLG